MQDKPRYSRISDILDLAIFMSSKFNGVTINEISKRYNVSRRTAERMRDSLTCIFPSVDEIETNDTQKHWGFINYSISQLITFTPKEIANIEQCQRRTTNKEMKEELCKTVEKIKSFNRKGSNSVENNIELYLQTEGYAVRQMPQYKISLNTLEIIREAVQHSKVVTGIYHNKKRTLEPLGMIYGEKIYLVAREKAKGKEIYNYLLHKFQDLKLTDKTFDKAGFNLQEYTNQSFGVYHGEILDVKLSFSPERAEEASMFNFHPTQKGKFEKDGSYTLTFKASGSKEIIWHIFKWGKDCKIIAPKSLKNEYKQYMKEILDNY
ncbi:WYL domain-containing protein [bacterium]|nr:WYL domain-containing protein [bacterium]